MYQNQMFRPIYRGGTGLTWQRKELLIFTVVVLLALILRIYFILGIKHPGLFGDDVNYDQLVRQLLDIGVYGYKSHSPNAYITPGYPIFLAIIYKLRGYSVSPLTSVRFAQALLMTGSVALVYLTGRRLGGKTTAVIAGLAAAVYPPMIWSTSAVLTESLFTFMFLAYFYTLTVAMDRHSLAWSGLSGILFGISVLIRPQVAPFFIIPFIIVFIKERRNEVVVLFLVFSIAFTAAMMPWWVRNYVTFHRVILSATQTGNPLLAGTDPYFREGPEKLFKGVKPQDQSKVAIQRITTGFKTEPGLYLKWFTVGKFAVMFKEPWVRFTGNFMRGFTYIHLPIVILGWLGILLSFIRPRLRNLAAAVLFVTMIQLIFLPLPRYVFPLMPFLMISGAYIIDQVIGLATGRHKYTGPSY